LVRAASLYEEMLRRGPASLDTYVNLAVLHWQATDFGLVAAMKLPSDFVGLAGERMNGVLDAASRSYLHGTEPRLSDNRGVGVGIASHRVNF